MNSCELILNIVIPLFIFLCFDPSISAWSSVGAFSFAVFMLLDEQSIVRAREEVHASQLLLLLPSSVHHCVIEWTSETHSASRHFTLTFSYFVKTASWIVERYGGPHRPCQLLWSAESWLNLCSDICLTHSSLCIIPSLQRLTIHSFDASRPPKRL